MKKFGLFILLCALCVLLASCKTEPVDGTLKGTVHDRASGLPVSGVTVSFGSQSATTNSSGSFNLGLGDTSGTVSDSFSMYATGYGFLYMTKVDLDAGTSTSVSFIVAPQDTAGYTTKTINGVLTDSSGTAWTAGKDYNGNVTTLTGGAGGFWAQVGAAGAYSITTSAFSDDCLLWFYTPFQTMVKADLSGSSPITLDVQQPQPGEYTDIDISGNAGNPFEVAFVSPYGMPKVANGISPDTVSLHNPYNYQVIFLVGAIDATFVGYPGHARMHQVISAPLNVSGALTLPSLDTSLGPDEPPDKGTLQYNAGVLSIDPVAGAEVYQYTLSDNGSGQWVGTILSDSDSTTLPSWLTTLLSGTLIDIEFQVIDASTTEFGPDVLEAMGRGTSPINFKIGMIVQDLGGGNYDTSYPGQVQF